MATSLGADVDKAWSAEFRGARYSGKTPSEIRAMISDEQAEDLPVVVEVRVVERYLLTKRHPADGNTLKSNIRRAAAGMAFLPAQEAAADLLDSLEAFADVGFDPRHPGVAETISAHFAAYVEAGIMSQGQSDEIRAMLSRKGSRAELLGLPLPSEHQIGAIMAGV